MESQPAAAAHTLSVFAPPYDRVHPCDLSIVDELMDVDDWKGCAIVWQLIGGGQEHELAVLRRRAFGLPLMVLLPPPGDVHLVLDILPVLRTLQPRLILPYGVLDTPYRLRQVLALAPRGIAVSVRSNHGSVRAP
jgi:hypothetical protein